MVCLPSLEINKCKHYFMYFCEEASRGAAENCIQEEFYYSLNMPGISILSHKPPIYLKLHTLPWGSMLFWPTKIPLMYTFTLYSGGVRFFWPTKIPPENTIIIYIGECALLTYENTTRVHYNTLQWGIELFWPTKIPLMYTLIIYSESELLRTYKNTTSVHFYTFKAVLRIRIPIQRIRIKLPDP